MAYELRFAPAAVETIQGLIEGGQATAVKLKKVRKALGLLQTDPTYPGLYSHLYQQFPGLEKGKVWDSYVDNRTPGAWRVYRTCGPNVTRDEVEVAVITVLVIGPHPKRSLAHPRAEIGSSRFAASRRISCPLPGLELRAPHHLVARQSTLGVAVRRPQPSPCRTAGKTVRHRRAFAWGA